MELKKMLTLEELVMFKNLLEVYEYLKKKSSLLVKEILDDDERLRQALLSLATNYRSARYVNGQRLVRAEDEMEEKLIELSHTFFSMESGCANIYLMLNLNKYLDGAKEGIIYSVFVYSEDGESATYAEELSGEKHHSLGIPDNVFFRQLPAMYLLSVVDSAKDAMIAISNRMYSTCIEYDHVDVKTGKVFETEV